MTMESEGNHTEIICNSIWEEYSVEKYEEIRDQIETPNVRSLDAGEILYYLSRPLLEQQYASEKTLERLNRLLQLLESDKTELSNVYSYTVYHVLNRCMDVFHEALSTHYEEYAKRIITIGSKICEPDQQAALLFNISYVLDIEQSVDGGNLVAAADYAERSLRKYYSLENISQMELAPRTKSAMLRIIFALYRSIHLRLVDPKKIRRKISTVRRHLTRHLKRAKFDEEYCICLTYRGFFWLHSYSWPVFFRISHSVRDWNSALGYSWGKDWTGALHFVSYMVEAYSFMIAGHPNGIEMAKTAGAVLDKNYFQEKFQSDWISYRQAVQQTSTTEQRQDQLHKFSSSYAPPLDQIEDYFRKHYRNYMSGDILKGRIEDGKYDADFAEGLIEVADRDASKQAESVRKKLDSSDFCRVVDNYLNSDAPYGLYLRNHMVENHITYQTRPRSYYFDDCLIKNHFGSLTTLKLDAMKDLERTLSAYNFISIGNILELCTEDGDEDNTPSIHYAFTANEDWRNIAFSLIAEADAIVMVLPEDYQFEQYSGVLEEREQLFRFGKSNCTVSIRYPSNEFKDAFEVIQKPFFGDKDTAERVMTQGSFGSQIVDSEELQEMFPRSYDSKDFEWSSLQIGTDENSLDQLKKFMDGRFGGS